MKLAELKMSDQENAFLKDLRSQSATGEEQDVRIYKNVRFELTPYQDGSNKVFINTVESLVGGNTGTGSVALDWLCRLADKHGILLALKVQSIGKNGPDNDKLIKWYKSKGFMRDGERYMERAPQ